MKTRSYTIMVGEPGEDYVYGEVDATSAKAALVLACVSVERDIRLHGDGEPVDTIVSVGRVSGDRASRRLTVGVKWCRSVAPYTGD